MNLSCQSKEDDDFFFCLLFTFLRDYYIYFVKSNRLLYNISLLTIVLLYILYLLLIHIKKNFLLRKEKSKTPIHLKLNIIYYRCFARNVLHLFQIIQ